MKRYCADSRPGRSSGCSCRRLAAPSRPRATASSAAARCQRGAQRHSTSQCRADVIAGQRRQNRVAGGGEGAVILVQQNRRRSDRGGIGQGDGRGGANRVGISALDKLLPTALAQPRAASSSSRKRILVRPPWQCNSSRWDAPMRLTVNTTSSAASSPSRPNRMRPKGGSTGAQPPRVRNSERTTSQARGPSTASVATAAWPGGVRHATRVTFSRAGVITAKPRRRVECLRAFAPATRFWRGHPATARSRRRPAPRPSIPRRRRSERHAARNGASAQTPCDRFNSAHDCPENARLHGWNRGASRHRRHRAPKPISGRRAV